MTQFVFALVTLMGSDTISTEYFNSIEVCRYYAKHLNNQHHYHYHNHDDDTMLFAQCIPTRVDPSKVTIYER
jgi:hypothetical protein